MPSKSARDLDVIFAQLEQERQQHVDAVAEIDDLCARFGITLSGTTRRRRKKVGRPRKAGRRGRRTASKAMNGRRKKRRGRPRAQKKARGGRRRRRGGASGPQSIVSFVQRSGGQGVTSADLAKHWQNEGRAGSVFVVLTKMVQSGQLKKQALKGERGSLYRVA